MFFRGCSLTSSPSSPDFPQHLNTDLNSSFNSNQAYLLFGLAGAGLHSVFLLHRPRWLKSPILNPATETITYVDLSFLVLCSSLLFSSALLLYSLICSFLSSTRFPVPLPLAFLSHRWDLTARYRCLRLVGISRSVLYNQKCPPLRGFQAYVSFLLVSPVCYSQK